MGSLEIFAELEPGVRERLMGRVRGAAVALPESDDPRVVEAAEILQKQCGVRVFGKPELREACQRSAVLQTMHETAARRGKSLKVELEARASDPLFAAGHAVSTGLCQAAVAGCATSTADVVRAVLATVGLKEGTQTLTSVFLMALLHPTPGGESLLVFGDAGVVPQPTSEQLVDIAQLSAQALSSWTGRRPVPAFLSFSTRGSAEHRDVEKVHRAAVLFQQRFPDRTAFGEVQFDAAVVPEVARRKLGSGAGEDAGRCNVLIFPDLDAGNICYKAVERLAKAAAWGPVVLGARLPFSDLSRGCSARDIAHVCCLSLAQSPSSSAAI